MSIQDFNQALNEHKSAQLQILEELKQPRVRQVLEAEELVDQSGRWLEWT